MSRMLLVLSAALGALTVAAGPVAAEADCTEQYTKCLNDSYYMTGPVLESLADLECGAEYTECIISKLRFW